jgi:hypothetical protein
MTRDRLTAARAYALFASDLSAWDRPSPAAVTAAITSTVRAHGTRGCACAAAAAYGEHPETAARRMRWARSLVEDIFVPPLDVTPGMWPHPGSTGTALERTASPGTRPAVAGDSALPAQTRVPVCGSRLLARWDGNSPRVPLSAASR